MNKIISINKREVVIGEPDGTAETFPISAVAYEKAKNGDYVDIYYSDDETVYITKAEKSENYESSSMSGVHIGVLDSRTKTSRTNKHIFVWIFTFFLGGFGADRFMRGQIGLGIFKLLFSWVTLGLWWLIDFIIALSKAYAGPYSKEQDFTFINGQYSK